MNEGGALKLCLVPEADTGESERNELIEFGKTHRLIGESKKFLAFLKQLKRFREFSDIILLEGETGTGKELAANAVHGNRTGEFVTMNCGDLKGEMGRVEIGGNARNAFTGSGGTARDGLFAQAQDGTLFLDEVQLLEPNLQPHFLRVLQSGTIRPVGSEKEIDVSNVRIVVASNENLDSMVNSGRLRRDLYYRISVLVVHIPSLRDRKEDIPLLIDHFILKHRERFNSSVKMISKNALVFMERYAWPGNVRELENTIRSILASKNDDEPIELRDLPEHIASEKQIAAGNPLLFQHQFTELPTLANILEIAERFAIEGAIKASRGNQSQAAQILKISRPTLKSRMDKFGIVFVE